MAGFFKTIKWLFVRILALGLIAAFCISIFVYWDIYATNSEKLQSYLQVYEGDKSLKNADLQDAIYHYEKAIKLYPKHYRALYNLANIYVVYEDYYSAIKNYEKALEVKPDFEVARINYAIILSQIYRIDDAINEYKKVLEYKPKFIKIPFLVDNKKTYEYNRGIAFYNMASAYRTKSLSAGISEAQKKEYLKAALKSYENAADILKSYNSNYNLALIHQLLKNNNQAAQYYCKAMEIEPMGYEAHFNYAVLLNDLKDYSGAQEEFKKAGLLLDSKGDSTKTSYIYGLLGEVNAKAALDNLKVEDFVEQQPEYKNGKLVIDTSKKSKQNQQFIKSFASCAHKELYLGDKK